MLEKVTLFKNLPPDQLQQLESVCVPRKYPKNTVLFMEGDASGQLFIIRKGQVCVHTNDSEGKQLALNYMSEGEYFGELSLLDDRPRSASVTTVDNCEFVCISREAFRSLIDQNTCMYQGLVTALVDRIRCLTDSMRDMALLDVYGRVANTLERFCGEDQTHPKLTHQDIANMVGASREMVSRVMKELVFGGYIEVDHKRVRILKPLPKHW